MKYVIWIPLLCCCFVFAQNTPQSGNVQPLVEEDLRALGDAGNHAVVKTYDQRYEGVRGTPFLQGEWLPGEVWTSSGSHIKKALLKYDAYKDELLFQMKGYTQVAIKTNVTAFLLLDAEQGDSLYFVKKTIALPGSRQLANEYFQLLYDGPSQLLKKHSKVLQRADYQGAYSSGKTYDEFISETQYYLRLPTGSYQKVKLNKKSLLKILDQHPQALKSYLKLHPPAWKSAAYLCELLGYYDSL